MKHTLADEESYRDFLDDTDDPYCWWCGRDFLDQPEDWYAPWLIERAHIVNKPRINDRRVANLLCSACHRLEHGERLAGIQMATAPTLENMVWLKLSFDPDFFDLDFMQRFSIANLPDAEPPPPEVRAVFLERQEYPS